MERHGPILIDCPIETDTRIAVDFLEGIGHPVDVCGGPEGSGACPILVGESCSKLDTATGIVFSLDLDRAEHRAILQRYQEILSDDTPVRAVVKPGQEKEYAPLLAGIQVWTHDPTVGELDGFAAEVEAGED